MSILFILDVKIAPIFLQPKKRNKNQDPVTQKQISNDGTDQSTQNTMIGNNNLTSDNRDNVMDKTTVNAFQKLINSSKEIGKLNKFYLCLLLIFFCIRYYFCKDSRKFIIFL